jgi:hypothetical protein
MHMVADAGLSPELIGGVMLLGLDCAGDICEPPPCLQQNPYDEFYEGPDRSCLDFDPEREGWQSTGPGIGNAYLVGRGNLYIGPRVQPAFEVVADSDTTGVQIDHWIANDNPGAVILVTPRGNQGAVAGFFGVKYDGEQQADGRLLQRPKRHPLLQAASSMSTLWETEARALECALSVARQ